ncbi:MAG: NAD(P)-dependent oxidoreductase [Leptospirales bacterium]
MNGKRPTSTPIQENEAPKEPILWVGTGHMGFPMVSHLLRGGWPVTVFNRTQERARELEKEGARLASTMNEALSRHRLVVTMLADDDAVRSVCEAPDGILDGLPAGGIHIVMGTLSPSYVESLEKQHAGRGHTLLSATVFGRPEKAQSASLTIVTAGPGKVLDTLLPFFQTLGSSIFRVGDRPDQANWIKILGNFTLGGLLETLAETLSLARRAGISPEKLIEILDTALYNSPVFRNYGSLMSRGSYQPAGFLMRHGLKDVRIASKEADQMEVPLPLADILRSGLLAGINRGYGEWDWSALGRVRDEDAGVHPEKRHDGQE